MILLAETLAELALSNNHSLSSEQTTCYIGSVGKKLFSDEEDEKIYFYPKYPLENRM